jgi:hypothetical protein
VPAGLIKIAADAHIDTTHVLSILPDRLSDMMRHVIDATATVRYGQTTI